MLEDSTGIALYRNPYRSSTLRFLKKRSGDISLAFRQVSTNSANVYEKVRNVAALIESLGKIPADGRHVSPFNGLTPALSCLDPQNKFPIMNQRTRPLLRSMREKADKEGVVALSRIIGRTYNIRDARELDVYANTETFHRPSARLVAGGSPSFRDVGVKSEVNSFAQIAAKQAVITKIHNEIINDLRDYLLARYKIAPKEDRFDALVLDWKGGRKLLIEAKSASEGPSGRSQIRQAIGQLYDYRFTLIPNNNVDLAVLLRKEPDVQVKRLLKSLGIELLWFKGKVPVGTIRL